MKKHLLQVALCVVLLAPLALNVSGCAQSGGGGDTLTDVLGEASDVAGALGHKKTAARINIAKKFSASQALNDPATREAKAMAIGQTMSLQAIANIGPIVQDEALQRYVNLVGMAISEQTPRYNQSFYVGVLWNDTPTGVSLPGGYVFISTGLIEALKDESELAAVLAHEIAHIVHEDGINMYQRQLQAGVLPEIVAQTGKEGRQLVQGYQTLWTDIMVNGYSREMETAADLSSVKYVYDAGYYPGGLMAFLQRAAVQPGLNHEGGKQHPTPQERINALLPELAKLRAYENLPKLADRYNQSAVQRVRALKPAWEKDIRPRWEATVQGAK